MRFRWISFLTLWTFLSGPMLALPIKAERPTDVRAVRRPAASASSPQRGNNASSNWVFAAQTE